MRRKRRQLLIWVSRRGALRIAFIGLALAAFAVWSAANLRTAKVFHHFSLPLSGKVIAVDAGHGGVDGGAESKDGLMEKQINLLIAMYLRDYLQQAGAVVVMTRETDTDLASPETKGLSRRKTEDLHKRAELIENSHADALVSIHLNSIPSSQWRGAQTFYYPEREEGKRLAVDIQDEIIRNLGNTDRSANIQPTMYLLKTIDIPSALVEVGFLSNPEEARLMADENYQKKMAAAIYQGILRFYSEPPASKEGNPAPKGQNPAPKQGTPDDEDD